MAYSFIITICFGNSGVVSRFKSRSFIWMAFLFVLNFKLYLVLSK